MSKFKRHWEMETGGPYGDYNEEIFKCTKCGNETFPEKGHSGEPDPNGCHHDCKMDHGDLRTVNTPEFLRNIRKIRFKGDGESERLSRFGVKVITRGKTPRVSRQTVFNKNFARIFPDSAGARV